MEYASASHTEYFGDDCECPIYSRVTSGYHVGELVDMLLKSDNEKVCTVQPLVVSENAAFIVDVEMVDLG